MKTSSAWPFSDAFPNVKFKSKVVSTELQTRWGRIKGAIIMNL